MVFNNLSEKEKYCKVVVDEVHVKPAVRYQGNHIIDFSHDELTKAARIALIIMIAPVMDAPTFVSRLIPVYSLNKILIRTTHKALIHQNKGCTFLLMCDTLRVNQACFN